MQMESSYDVFLLIRTLEAVTFKFEGHKYQAHALHDTEADFYTFSHSRDAKTPSSLECFKAKVSVAEHIGGEGNRNLLSDG